ncbi:tRNA (guanosine(46)-N7)-methyltransferase TrmB [Marinicrinis sediminis]|uniref:tRNA (guanine-N(7)-)-methyltransferase n=1 Tax=Marinicrinis sediminis TaxID=1652465 RepID=A0ABW5R9C4_9BACL
MRLRRRRDTRQYLENETGLVQLRPEEHKGNWHAFFGNDRPTYVELGMGKGNFISEMSAKFPEINFIGVDMYDELIRKASEKAREVHGKAEEEQIPNLALLLVNVQQLTDIFAENEIAKIFLNFSDPWPKKRHAPRRLTHEGFLRKYAEVLNDDGILQLRTDSVTLFEFSLNSFADCGLRMRNIHLDLHREGEPEEHVYTEYERKFVEQGVRIHQCEVLMGKKALLDHEKRLQSVQSEVETS